MGAGPGRGAGVGAGGLPARVGLLRAVFDRSRRAGGSGPDAADGQLAALEPRARQVRSDRRDRGRSRRAGRGHRDAADGRAGRAGARHPAAGRPSRAAGQARASRSTTRCSGTCTISGPSSSCRAARCSTASGARASRGAWRAPSRRCASGSPATSCAGCASSPRRSTRSRPRSPSSSARSRRSSSTEPGFGPLTAAKLVGEIAGAGRFASDAKLARAAGLAPIPVSSGRTDRHRLDRGGNRQINAAIHRVAVTRARCHPETIEFIARKKTEGKTHREAIRCLKRHLARRIWQLLARAPPGLRNGAPPINFLTKEQQTDQPAGARAPRCCLAGGCESDDRARPRAHRLEQIIRHLAHRPATHDRRARRIGPAASDTRAWQPPGTQPPFGTRPAP